ncbi:MAG TPA: DNA ligase D [Terriglobales bacterium]|nr:DNA ligase D [Terriglobales bacterium]
MSLDEYLRKRVFEQTPEPRPSKGRGAGNRFYVQRHTARRLHYDFRLEYEGTLKSWAVPKGPTLDPKEKRLAVMVEDHPLEYGEFEGTIPEGNYGAGGVLLWDRGTYTWLGDKPPAEQWQRGDLKFQLHGEKLMGDFALVRMKGRGKKNEWLLIKKKDFAARPGWDAEDDLRSVASAPEDLASIPGAVRAAMPERITPMLAMIGQSLPEGAEWVYEVKWDGVRVLCFLQDGKVRLVSRSGRPMDAQYPELVDLAPWVKAESAIVDGEIVVLDEQGRPSFSLLQPRMMAGASAAGKLARSQPVILFAFDLLYCDGVDLRGTALVERKRVLSGILRPGGPVRYSEHFVGHGAELMQAARGTGLEGIVAKRALSPYQHRRSPDWLKLKVQSQQEFVICGMLAGERKPFGSLVLGYFDEGKLHWAGNVGSGFDGKTLELVGRLLEPLVQKKSPLSEPPEALNGVTWVKPEVVCTVKFAAWTPEGRLRAPVFLGIRTDVPPDQCVREESGTLVEPAAAAKPVLLPAGGPEEVALQVDGRRLKFTHLSKVFFPREGYSKRDLINYYDAVAELLVPHLSGRPLTLKRYPDGIEGEHFFQKEAPAGIPAWMRVEPVRFSDDQEPTRFVLCEDRPSLLCLANLGCIDQNPTMSRVGSIDQPDFILIDLDPSDCGFDRIVEAAQLIRRKLGQVGLEGYPKTTGGDGMHIYVPVEPGYTFEQTRTFAEVLARLVASERPDLFTTPRAVSRREKGKVYFDHLQNGEGKTISAPYVLRAYPGAPVATPLAWREVAPGLSPGRFHLGNVLDRFQRLGDIFRPVLTQPQSLEEPLEKLAELVHAAAGRGQMNKK